jgi:hypothetical protein
MATKVSQRTSEERNKTVTMDRVYSQEPTAAKETREYVRKSSGIEHRLHASQIELENRMRAEGARGVL